MSRNSLEFATKKKSKKKLKKKKTRTKQEMKQKTFIKPEMLKYTTLQYYIDKKKFNVCAPIILDRFWRLPFGAKIVCTKAWRMQERFETDLAFIGNSDWWV